MVHFIVGFVPELSDFFNRTERSTWNSQRELRVGGSSKEDYFNCFQTFHFSFILVLY